MAIPAPQLVRATFSAGAVRRALLAAPPVFACRLYCSQSARGYCGRYWLVVVYRRLGEARAAMTGINRYGRRVSFRCALGACQELQRLAFVGTRFRRHPCLGIVTFSRRHVSVEIIVHELTHAAHDTVIRRFPGAQLDALEIQEPLAYTAGRLARQFWRAWQSQ